MTQIATILFYFCLKTEAPQKWSTLQISLNLLTFFPWANSPMQSIKTPVSVTCHGASQETRDFDAAIAYFFSAQAVFQADAASH